MSEYFYRAATGAMDKAISEICDMITSTVLDGCDYRDLMNRKSGLESAKIILAEQYRRYVEDDDIQDGRA